MNIHTVRTMFWEGSSVFINCCIGHAATQDQAVKDEDKICSMWGKKIKDCDGTNGRGGECGLKGDPGMCPKTKAEGK
jgi:hypothetical protein